MPPSWSTSAYRASIDPDNLHLASHPSDVIDISYKLRHIVIDGHATELGKLNVPPSGLQLELRTRRSTVVADTLVVANLGYMQLRTSPGVYQLQIRPGPGSRIYQLETTSSSMQATGNQSSVVVDSFDGLTIYPAFSRKLGQEDAKILDTDVKLDDPSTTADIRGKLSSVFKHLRPAQKVAEEDKRQADINIFTVASGLLYEVLPLSLLSSTN